MVGKSLMCSTNRKETRAVTGSEQGKSGVRCGWSKAEACQGPAGCGEESALLGEQREALEGFTRVYDGCATSDA